MKWVNDTAPAYGGGNLHSVETFTALRVTTVEGKGADESDPVRHVVHIFDEKGKRVACIDAWREALIESVDRGRAER